MDTEIPSMTGTMALAEKKVAMALDDIIKLSKSNTNVNKGKKPRREKNENRNCNGATKNKTSKVRHYVNSLSAVRQGAVAKRRSNVQGIQFPVTANIARKALLSVRGEAERMTNANQPRLIPPPVRNISIHARSIAKRDEKVENGGGKRKTLDSRFASMKEQRKRNKNYGVGVGVQVQRLPPWARASRFH